MNLLVHQVVKGSLNNMSKSSLLKNARNYAEYLRKKERGPVKAFFHITKNENVPAIEQQGLLTNHPNANINSAAHPFRKHGTDAGGVWVTTEPTAFPVYGTTIGGKNGNNAARADALSTIKIEVPLPELAKMKAVQDPYGRNILRQGDDTKAIEKFPTWAGIDVPTTVLLNDVKPQWLKNIGYVEEAKAAVPAASHMSIDQNLGNYQPSIIKGLNKADRQALTGLTGADRKLLKQGAPHFVNLDKSPALPVREQIFKSLPITIRMPQLPMQPTVTFAARSQGTSSGPKYIHNGISMVTAPNEVKRYSADFIPAHEWTNYYQDYVKPGESVKDRRSFKFAPGAISRGMGGSHMPSIKDRAFNWDEYKQVIARGLSPSYATYKAKPRAVLDWDNIIDINGRYEPAVKRRDDIFNPSGAISRGTGDFAALARARYKDRRKAANEIHSWRNKTSNAQVVKNYGVSMTDDELRELDRLEAKLTPDLMLHPGVAAWSKLENHEILRTRQRALDKIKGSWLYDYLLGEE